MKRLFYNGRHVHVGLCFTLQYIMDLDTSFRTNVDITIVLREQIQANRERYYKYFFGQFPTQRAFNMARRVHGKLRRARDGKQFDHFERNQRVRLLDASAERGARFSARKSIGLAARCTGLRRHRVQG